MKILLKNIKNEIYDLHVSILRPFICMSPEMKHLIFNMSKDFSSSLVNTSYAAFVYIGYL